MVNRLCESLRADKTCRALKGVGTEQINEAENRLGLKFSDEYRAMLQEFGIVSIYGHELIGLGASKRLDVVDNTLTEREINIDFPSEQYVVEETGMDGIVITQDQRGNVYQYQPNIPLKKIAGSISEYLYK